MTKQNIYKLRLKRKFDGPKIGRERAAELAAEIIETHRDRLVRKAAAAQHIERLAFNAIRSGIRPKRVAGWLISAPPGDVLEFVADQMAKVHKRKVTGARR